MKSGQKSSMSFRVECETWEVLGVMFCNFTSRSPPKPPASVGWSDTFLGKGFLGTACLLTTLSGNGNKLIWKVRITNELAFQLCWNFWMFFFSPKVLRVYWMWVLKLTSKIYFCWCKQKLLLWHCTIRSCRTNYRWHIFVLF